MGFGTGDMRDYIDDRVRHAEERRYRQLEALGVGGSLRSRRSRGRPPLPAPLPESLGASPAVSLASLKPDLSGLSAPEGCGMDAQSPNCSSLLTSGAPAGAAGRTPDALGASGAPGTAADGVAKGRAGSRHMCPAGSWRPKARECRQTPQGDIVCTIRRQ